MRKRFFVLALIVFTYMGDGCAPSSPSARQAGNAGITGTTRAEVVSGVPGGSPTGGPASIEFAIAPVMAGNPVYNRAIFVKSDAGGAFHVELAPAKYWIGPKGKALDPTKFDPGVVRFSEMILVVQAGSFTSVELVQTS